MAVAGVADEPPWPKLNVLAPPAVVVVVAAPDDVPPNVKPAIVGNISNLTNVFLLGCYLVSFVNRRYIKIKVSVHLNVNCKIQVQNIGDNKLRR